MSNFDTEGQPVSTSADNIVPNVFSTIPTATTSTINTIVNTLVNNLKNEEMGTGSFLTTNEAQTISVAHNFTNGVSGINKTHVGLSNIDNTSDENKPISTLQQAALDGLSSDINTKANINSPTFTGTVSGISKAMVGLANVTDTSDADKQISTLQQTALNAKANIISPSFTGTVSGISKAMVGLANVDDTTDAAKPVSTLQQAAIDLAIANLVSSAPSTLNTLNEISNSLNNDPNFNSTMVGLLALKAPSSSPTLNNATFTGSITGIGKSDVGLNNVNNTSDANKPVSDLTQVELDKKPDLASSNTYTGNNNNFNNNVTLGSNTSDTLTINATVSANAINLTPTQLSKVEHLSNITSDVKALIDAKTTKSAIRGDANTWTNTNDFDLIPTTTSVATLHNHLTNKTYVDDKVSDFITNNNSWTGLNQFNTSLPSSSVNPVNNGDLTTKIFCDNTYLKLAGNADIQGTKNFQNISVAGTTTCSGNISCVGHINLGGDNLDIITLNGTISANGVNVTPSELSKVEYLSDVTSSVQDQLDNKTTLSAVQGNTNVFTGFNTFSGNVKIGENQGDLLEIRSNIAVGYSTISPTTLSKVRYLDISDNMTDLLAQRTTLTEIRESNNIFSGTNDFNNYLPRSSLVPANDNDITNKAYVDMRAREFGPSVFQYGQRCPIQSVSPLVNPTAITSTECYLNFSESNFTIFSCMIEFSYSFVLALAGGYTPSQIFSYNCIYNVVNNFGTVTLTPIRVDRVNFGGVPTVSNVANGWTLTPLVFSTSLTNLTKVKIAINFPNIANNGLSTRWIPLTHASVRVISSKPSGVSKMLYPVSYADPTNNVNYSNSSGGHCYITQT